MKIGIFGAGNVGLPLISVFAKRKIEVYVYDIDKKKLDLEKNLNNSKELDEEAKNKLILPSKSNSKVKICFDPKEVINACKIIFITVQTPSKKQFNGDTIIKNNNSDYSYKNIIDVIKYINKSKFTKVDVVLVSTIIPGTYDKYLKKYITKKINFIYHPLFISNGTVARDFLNPDLILVGTTNQSNVTFIKDLYNKIIKIKKTINFVSIYNAEIIKTSYNTFIALKLSFVNTLMELGHIMGNIDIDVVTSVLSQSNNRLLSKTYFSAGLGIGGGCQPRDNIAMSFLANKKKLSSNIFNFVISQREQTSKWISNILLKEKKRICILGYAYKRNSNQITGSNALLIFNYLSSKTKKNYVVKFDPNIDSIKNLNSFIKDRVIFIGMNHDFFKNLKFPKKSIIYDPWNFLRNNKSIYKYISIGRV